MLGEKTIHKEGTAGAASLFERLRAVRAAIRELFDKNGTKFELDEIRRAVTAAGKFLDCDIDIIGGRYAKAENDDDKKEKPQSIISRIEYKNNLYGILTVYFEDGRDPAEEQFIAKESSNELAIEFFSLEKNKDDTELWQELNDARSLSRAIFETTRTATLMVNEASIILASNQEFAKLAGYTNEEIDGLLSWKNFIFKEDVEKMIRHQKLRSVDPTSAPKNYEFRFIDRYGNVKDIYGTFNLMPESTVIIGSFMDITAQKKLESELIRISEQERQRISNDLHDGLGPHFVGVKFMVNILEKKLIAHDMPHEVKAIHEIDTLLTQGIKQIRRLVKGLCPVDIDAEGLIVAFEDLVMNTEQVYGVKCSFEHDESLFMTDSAAATHLYLIAQESVNNAIKHSKADTIRLTIAEQKPGIVVMTISDNGQGFKKRLDNDSGVGINIMKYRARLINASIDIGQNEFGGTSVQCFIVVPETKKAALKKRKHINNKSFV